jgi:hypothetical protein
MPAITTAIDNFRPLVADGSMKERCYRVTSAINTGDTFTVVEFNTVVYAFLIPSGAAAATAPNVTLSGVGNKTLTFNLSASLNVGTLLVVKGF